MNTPTQLHADIETRVRPSVKTIPIGYETWVATVVVADFPKYPCVLRLSGIY